MRRLIVSLTLAGLAAGLLALPASAATVRVVDNDGKASAGSCGSSTKAFKTIQGAVNASSAGDTILVCPGTYTEQVLIGPHKDGLTLRSVGYLAATIRAPLGMTGERSIVFLRHGADRVTIKDFSIRYRTPALGTAGVDACGALGAIRVDAAKAIIESNNIAAVGPSTLVCGLAYGVFIGYGPEGDSAQVRYNIVRDIMQAAIVVGDSGNTMTAFRNQVRYHHTGQSFTNTSSVRRVSSKWRLKGAHAAGPGAPGAGVVVFFGASGTIRENIVEGSVPGHGPLSSEPTAYLSAGIMVESSAGSTVASNRVYRSYDGIQLITGLGTALTPPAVTVKGNLTLSGFFGVYVDSLGATVKQNQVNANVVGILATNDSSSNTITENDVTQNLDVDCVDETSDDAATVANLWSDNEANSDNPNGICVPVQP